MSSNRKAPILRKHEIRSRAHRILALVPRHHAPSETSDRSSDDGDNEFLSPPTSLASSPPRYFDPSLRSLHLLSDSDDDVTDCEGDENDLQEDNPHEYNCEEKDQDQENTIEQVPLTPIIQDICPLSPALPNYDNNPSLSSIPSLPTPVQSNSSVTRKTRSSKTIRAPPAKKIKKIPKFTLPYKWKKAVFRHSARIEDNTDPDPTPTNNKWCLDYFYDYLYPDVISDITEQSNLYSVQETGRSIHVSEQEMKDFLAIHILMRIVEMRSYLDYWSNKFRYPQIADIMSLKRYQQIRRYLHFVDNNLDDGDNYFKVRPVVEKVRRNCLSQDREKKYSIDEMMIAYKGRKAN